MTFPRRCGSSPAGQLRSLPEVRLDLHLPPELVLHPTLLQLLLEEDLQGHDEHGVAFPGQVHIAKFTLPQGTADVKVLQAPSLPGGARQRLQLDESLITQGFHWCVPIPVLP